jgi:transcriptional regulator with XRE-family HTH domain
MIGQIREIILNEFDGNRSEFARKVGMSPQIVSQWLKGRNVPSEEAIEKIAAALGVTVELLKSGTMYDYRGDDRTPHEIELHRIEANITRAVKAVIAGKEVYLDEPAPWLMKIKRLLEDESDMTKEIMVQQIRSTLAVMKGKSLDIPSKKSKTKAS